MTNPIVSVLMTSFNKEQFIASAIESVLASSHTDFELLIVDDGSTDQSVAIANNYAAIDTRVHVYVNEINLGDYPNRNRAASLAKGKYIKYVDADDHIYPWGLEILVQTMEQFPEAGWGICSLKPDPERPYPFALNPAEIFEYQNYKASLFHCPPLSSIIKKDVFDAEQGFSGKRQMSDTEMWHILALKYPMVLMGQGIVWYRIYDGQESTQIRNDIAVRTRYAVAKYHFYQNNTMIPLAPEQRKSIASKMHRAMVKYIMINLAKGKFRSAYTIYKLIPNHDYDFKALH
jgi:glycosyltransferase involved in cell wall biosynthesis